MPKMAALMDKVAVVRSLDTKIADHGQASDLMQLGRRPEAELAHPDFGTGRIDTGFLEKHLDDLIPDAEPDGADRRGAAAVSILAAEEDAPLPGLAGLRLNAAPRLTRAGT